MSVLWSCTYKPTYPEQCQLGAGVAHGADIDTSMSGYCLYIIVDCVVLYMRDTLESRVRALPYVMGKF